MNLNNNVPTDGVDRPLIRADIVQLIQNAGGSDGLDVSGQNLQAIDLSGIDLSEADLSGMLITAESKEDLLHAIGVRWST